jgi:hypothetical protein
MLTPKQELAKGMAAIVTALLEEEVAVGEEVSIPESYVYLALGSDLMFTTEVLNHLSRSQNGLPGPLITRKNRRVKLTEQGRIIARKVERMLK